MASHFIKRLRKKIDRMLPVRVKIVYYKFGTHWRRLMEGYLAGADAIGALLVRYEDLVGPKPPLDELDAYLGIQTDHGVLTKKVGSSERGGEKVQVNALERWLLKRAVGSVSERLGYVW